MVANPPFSYRWEPKDEASEDMRFKNHGIAPKSAADFAFLLLIAGHDVNKSFASIRALSRQKIPS